MQQPLFAGTRPNIKDLGQFQLREPVAIALAAGFKIRQQNNGPTQPAASLDMALSLHWLVVRAHAERGIDSTYKQLCHSFKSAHFARTKKSRDKTFYQGRVKTLLAVCLQFGVLEGEIFSGPAGRTATELKLRLLNPDRIWQMYWAEPARPRGITGQQLRAAWANYTPQQQLHLAGSKAALDWATKQFLPFPEPAPEPAPEPEPEPEPELEARIEAMQKQLDLLCRHLGVQGE